MPTLREVVNEQLPPELINSLEKAITPERIKELGVMFYRVPSSEIENIVCTNEDLFFLYDLVRSEYDEAYCFLRFFSQDVSGLIFGLFSGKDRKEYFVLEFEKGLEPAALNGQDTLKAINAIEQDLGLNLKDAKIRNEPAIKTEKENRFYLAGKYSN